MSREKLTDTFGCFCALLSPFTPAEEVEELRQVAGQGKVDWVGMAGCANRAGLAPALRSALRDKGVWAAAPPTFQAYLDEIHRFNVARNGSLLSELLEVTRLLNGAGITPLLLKGGAALATDLFPDPGMRFMWDLDLLVPEGERERSVAVLLGAGYETQGGAAAGEQMPHHHAPLLRPGAPAAVELHHRVLTDGGGVLEPAAVWARSRPYAGCRLPGATAAVMSPTDEVLYCFAHSELAHRHHQCARVDARHLHHFAWLCHRTREEIDWHSLEALKRHPLFGRPFRDYLYLAERLFRMYLPVSAAPDPRSEHHFRAATSAPGGWGRLCHMTRLFFREAVWAFSRERLAKLYPQEDVTGTRLRLRHLLFLLARYRRPDAWRTRLRGLEPH